MKKFIKVFIIVLLVLASIAGTCYFFFKNLKEKNNTTASFAELLYSEEQAEFRDNLETMSSYINSDGTDGRIDLIVETHGKLEEILFVLSSYHIQNDSKINNEKISKALNQTIASKNLLNSMMREYYIKKDSPYFDRHAGANDFYQQCCNYLVSLSRLVSYMNAYLQVNKSSDFKFSMFDIYSNVVVTTFSSTKFDNSRVVVEDMSNIGIMNNLLMMNNSIIITACSPFDNVINQFNNYYYNCGKAEFAKNLSSNLLAVNSADQDTNEKIAIYYFKEIFGV